MTRNIVLSDLKRQVKALLRDGCTHVELHPRLCENYYLIYRIENRCLMCYVRDDDGERGYRAEELSNGQLYTFADELWATVERSYRRAYQSALACEIERKREQILHALSKCN